LPGRFCLFGVSDLRNQNKHNNGKENTFNVSLIQLNVSFAGARFFSSACSGELGCFAADASSARSITHTNTQPEPGRVLSWFTTAKDARRFIALPPVLETQGLAGIRCLAPPLVTSALVIGAGRWSLTMVIQNTAGGVQRFCSNWRHTETPPSGTDALFITGTVVAGANFNDGFGAFSLFTTATGSATTPWAIRTV